MALQMALFVELIELAVPSSKGDTAWLHARLFQAPDECIRRIGRTEG